VLVPGSVYEDLLAVKGLRNGTPGVRETTKVRPVPLDHIKAVLAKAPAMLKAMVLFAYSTGARPGEVCALKPCHLDRSRTPWIYSVPPDANRTEHRDQDRKVYIGPKAKKILAPWLEAIAPEEHVFSPIRAEQLRQKARRDTRKTPLYSSHVKQQEAHRPFRRWVFLNWCQCLVLDHQFH
jgi:integrase